MKSMKRALFLFACVFVASIAMGEDASRFYTRRNPTAHDATIKKTFEYTGVDGAQKVMQCTSDNVWSGTKADLDKIVKKAEREYGFENAKHLGRNATMLVPASLPEMKYEIEKGNDLGWEKYKWDAYHDRNTKNNFINSTAVKRWWGEDSAIVKYVNSFGGEVVYDTKSGRILTDEYMGTKNFAPGPIFLTSHQSVDIDPHEKNKGYKYVGILTERDVHNPDVYYIIDGQTGRRMSIPEVNQFPTTVSNMWKDLGLACVEDDANDIVPFVSTDDLKKMNLDDKNGDWCKCWNPECIDKSDGYGNWIITFVCVKCKKVNVAYAKKALLKEAESRAKGQDVQWIGPNAKERALNAGNSKSSRGGESK